VASEGCNYQNYPEIFEDLGVIQLYMNSGKIKNKANGVQF
jgi:hypothetical protein